MASADSTSVSALLQRMRAGDQGAEGELYSRVHEALRAMAHRQLRGQRGDASLHTTALIHETYLKVFDGEWHDRHHFLAYAARAMRSVLIDRARRARSARREAPGARIELDELVQAYEQRAHDLDQLDQALERLAQIDERAVRLIELRFFAGLPMEEVAAALGMSVRTAQREWAVARAWLREQIR